MKTAWESPACCQFNFVEVTSSYTVHVTAQTNLCLYHRGVTLAARDKLLFLGTNVIRQSRADVYCVGQGYRIKVTRLPHLTCCTDSLHVIPTETVLFFVVAILLILLCQDVTCA